MTSVQVGPVSVAARALQSQGVSAPAIYRMVSTALDGRHSGGGTLIDVGCGTGTLWTYVAKRFDRYVGIDVVRYEGLPTEADFVAANLDEPRTSLSDASGDVVVAVETIEHLENPRAFMRELTRLTKPSGWVIVTTPNQLSLLSKLTLVLKNQFSAFQDSCYPAHLTALLEVDLRRMAVECGLSDKSVLFSNEGRLPGTAWHYPHWMSRWFPRPLSDNVLLAGQKLP